MELKFFFTSGQLFKISAFSGVLMVLGHFVKAQDTIYTKSGEKIPFQRKSLKKTWLDFEYKTMDAYLPYILPDNINIEGDGKIAFSTFNVGPVYSIRKQDFQVDLQGYFGLTQNPNHLLYRFSNGSQTEKDEYILKGNVDIMINPGIKVQYLIDNNTYIFTSLNFLILKSTVEIDRKTKSAESLREQSVTIKRNQDFSTLKFLIGLGFNF